VADMSIAVLVGRLTRDAELKFTPSGLAICKFGLAVSVRVKKETQWVDEPNFYNVILWGKDGERLNQYLTKGKQVAIEGSMRQDKWEKDGVQRMAVEITANSVALLGGGERQAAPQEAPKPTPQARQPESRPPVSPPPGEWDDQIMF